MSKKNKVITERQRLSTYCKKIIKKKNVYYCECIYKDRIICNNSQGEDKDL